jgi:plasmid stability protein
MPTVPVHREVVDAYYRIGAMVLSFGMKTMSLKVPDDLDARLAVRAKAFGKSKSELTREALASFLEGGGASGASCLDLVRDLVGTAKGPGDLASNKKHLRGYGR